MLGNTRKLTRWTAVLLALVLLAAACDDDDQDDQPVTGPTDETGTATTAAPETSDPTSVVIGLEQELTNFNNLTAGDNLLAGRQVIRTVWPTCTRTLPNSTFEPYFCESLPTVVNEDPLIVEYKLRADANWSDGTPVSSDDMVFYFENCNDPEDDCAGTAGFDSAELEVVDAKTVRLSWPEGQPFVEYIALFSGPFPPAHLGLDWTEGFQEDPMLAAGPYQVDEYNPGSDLTLVPNPTWFGDGPHIDEVTFRFISDVGNLPLALENGEVDVIYPQPQVDLVAQIAALDSVASTITFGPTWEHITFNTATVPVEVRRAIALALDRELIVTALMRPFSQSAQPLGNRVYMNGQAQYQDNTPAEFQVRDVDAARAALEQGGWTPGNDGVYTRDERRLSLRIRTTGGNPRREQFQELVQNQLGEAGIEITIDNLPGGEIFGPVFGSENDPPGPPGDFDLVIFAWVGGPLPASSTLQVFGTGSDSNPGAYVDDQVNDLLIEATVTLDLDRQAELLNRADALMWQSLPNVPVYQLPFFLAWNDSLINLEDNPTLESFTWNLEEWAFS
ncbi:MAG: ABC transporter family substrate-binding protein [Acidimicrobiaceae bacterium]|nr:ABC transporter family substrate-binding protein [Acidimicrobiaceae bacterium]MYD07274.1 ABC transporter family substrate-binding protein [Acidimicrobiaceae bacterium]MYI59004.1 ABC transporter family substrate-binding protein [Acidimicrobiaceae bacterium]